MSRSQPTIVNPAKHFFTWSGSKGQLVWWNKEESREVEVKLPFEFMVLDELATITGYDDQAQAGYYSNEVRSVAREELTVKTKGGTREVGLYKDLKCRAHGAKYAKSIYLVHKIGDDYVIGNMKASGAALTAWIELSQKYKVENGKVRLTGSTEGKKGATTYQIPTFEWDHSSTEEDTEAVKLDRGLQVYLSHYFAAANLPSEEIPSDVDQTVGLATPEQTADYEKRKRSAREDDKEADDAVEKYQKHQTASEDFGDEEINLSDIPF